MLKMSIATKVQSQEYTGHPIYPIYEITLKGKTKENIQNQPNKYLQKENGIQTIPVPPLPQFHYRAIPQPTNNAIKT